MNALTIISQSIAAGGLAGARPVLTLTLLIAWALFVDPAQLPNSMEWLVDEVTLGVGALLSVAEHFLRTDPDFEELMRVPNAVLGVVVALCGAMLLAGMGESPERWQEVAWLYTAGLGTGVIGTSLGLSAVTSLALWKLRSWMFEAVADFSFIHRWYGWLETGGVVGLLVLILSLPFLSIVVAGLLIIGSAGSGGLIYLVQKRRDEAARMECPNEACPYRVRKEALICPACGTEVAAVPKAS
jgi:hypothetical protein